MWEVVMPWPLRIEYHKASTLMAGNQAFDSTRACIISDSLLEAAKAYAQSEVDKFKKSVPSPVPNE